MSGVRARVDPLLGARVVGRTALRYAHGPDRALDRPAHVRAGSALVRLGARCLAVVQDDASFIAILDGVGDPETGVVIHDVPLPAVDGIRLFDETRGNKRLKLDLEAALVVDDGKLLVALGSGSTHARERIVLVEEPSSEDPRVTVVEARALYAALRENAELAGSELNVEGAAIAGEDVLIFQRGNGATVGARLPVDATARIDRRALIAYLRSLACDPAHARPCPPVREVTQWDLGAIEGTRLTFTDGVAHGRWTGFLACAEASPDATRDGPVSGVAIGRLDDRAPIAELGAITDEQGAPLTDKAEGITFDDTDPRRAWLVIDRDDPAAPADLLELRLGAGWTQ